MVKSMNRVKYIPLIIILVLISSLFYLSSEKYLLNKYNHFSKSNNYERLYDLFDFKDSNIMSIDKFKEIYKKNKDNVSVINVSKKLFIFNNYKLKFNSGVVNNIELLVPSKNNVLIDGKDIEKYLVEDKEYEIYKKYIIDEMFVSKYNISISNENAKMEKNFIPNKKTYTFEYNNPKIMVYMFKQKDCPHCIEESAYMKELLNDYSNIFELVSYEYTDKYDLFMSSLKHFKVQRIGYPLTVIGDDYVFGFGSSDKTRIKRKIFESYRNKATNYVDTIK